jgi:uncharacterized Tic20 family protein
MKNNVLATRIKELRNRNGYSQEELSRLCQLSLRTIQRIENGETEARGDTLRRIAQAFNVVPAELTGHAENEEKNYLALLNLSALSFFAFPLLGIIVPLIVWVVKRDKIKHLNETAKKLLNFQISWVVLLCIVYLLVFTSMFHLSFGRVGQPESILIAVVVLYLFNGLLVLINTIRSFNDRRVFYQPSIPFIR